MSLGGGKVRPEDLFDSLRAIREENKPRETSASEFATKFFKKFKSRFTEKDPFDDNIEDRSNFSEE